MKVELTESQRYLVENLRNYEGRIGRYDWYDRRTHSMKVAFRTLAIDARGDGIAVLPSTVAALLKKGVIYFYAGGVTPAYYLTKEWQ